MRYSSLVGRIRSAGLDGWAVHFKASQALLRGEDVIILSVGDPDFSTPQPIVQSAISALERGDTHYAEIAGRSKLRAAIAADIANRTGQPLDADNVIVCAGTQNALMATSLCLFEHGDEIIGLDPMYLTYEATLRAGGASLVRVAQSPESGFRPDINAIRAAITERTRAIVITTPNNPTGVVLLEEELTAIGQIAIDHDLWILADEVYSDLVFEGDHTSIASLPGMAERTVTVSSLSKSHAMTGWRVGWAIAPHELIAHMNRLQINVNYGLPGFIQEAAYAALTEHRNASRPMRDTYQRRRDLAAEILRASPHLDVLVPQAGMYLLVDVRQVDPSSKSFAHALFDATGVSVIDAGAFGISAEGWVRISFTIDDERLAEGCRRIVAYAAGQS